MEKRNAQRINTENILSFIKFKDNGYEVVESLGVTKNISENGILFKTPTTFSEDDEIRIDLALQESILNIIGEVVRVEKENDGYIVAVQFKDIDKNDLKVLKEILGEKE